MSDSEERLARSFSKLRRFAGEVVEFYAGGGGTPIELSVLDDSGITQTLQLGGVDGVARVLTIDRNEYDAAVGDRVRIAGVDYYVIRVVHTSAITTQVWLSQAQLPAVNQP